MAEESTPRKIAMSRRGSMPPKVGHDTVAAASAGLGDAPAPREISMSLRGSLIRKVGRMATSGSGEMTGGLPPAAFSRLFPSLEGRAAAATEVLAGKGTFVRGAELKGLWHYARGPITGFDPSRITGKLNKFGAGAYFGVGELSGETVEELKRSGVKHDAAFTGNVLVLDLEDVRGVTRTLRDRAGEPPDRLKSSFKAAPVADYLRLAEVDGQRPDAVMVYMDREHQMAEFIVPPPVLGRVTIAPSAR